MQFDAMSSPSYLEFPFVPTVDGDFLPDNIEVGVFGVFVFVLQIWLGDYIGAAH